MHHHWKGHILPQTCTLTDCSCYLMSGSEVASAKCHLTELLSSPSEGRSLLPRAAPWQYLPRASQKLWLFPSICPPAVYELCLQAPYSLTCATQCPAQCLASVGSCYFSEGTKLWMTNRMQCSFEFILQIWFCFISLSTFIYWPSSEITLVSH